VLFVVAIAALALIPTAFAMTPTGYSGNRYYIGNGEYESYTYTNGYLPGGNCWNTVDAYIGETSTTNSRYKLGENWVFSQWGPGINAYHGVGVGEQISYRWQQN
jgi:hypothetical protein